MSLDITHLIWDTLEEAKNSQWIQDLLRSGKTLGHKHRHPRSHTTNGREPLMVSFPDFQSHSQTLMVSFPGSLSLIPRLSQSHS